MFRLHRKGTIEALKTTNDFEMILKFTWNILMNLQVISISICLYEKKNSKKKKRKIMGIYTLPVDHASLCSMNVSDFPFAFVFFIKLKGTYFF